MLFNRFKQVKMPIISKTLVLAMVASLIIGALAGAGGSYLFLLNMDKFGFLVNNSPNDGLKLEKVNLVDEESATINVVKEVNSSVVSIIISKEVPSGYNSSDPFSAFNNFFNFGLPFNSQNVQPQQDSPTAPKTQKQEVGGGSGFIVSADGLILTNKHVVDDEAAEYTVITNEGQKYDAKVLAKDPINDLAVVKIEATGLKPLVLGDSDNLQIGQTVIAIGNTLSEFNNTVTKGVISGINRTIEAGGSGFSETLEQAIQTDAAINPGNSGGPLLNIKGEVIGINTAISQSGQLIGFAIPINEAKSVLESIQKYGKIVRPFLGVRYIILNKQIAEANDLKVDYGALVSRGSSADALAVVPGSPADKAGIVENDIILKINGQKIDESHSLARMLAKYAPGDEVELKIWHKGDEKTVKVKLTERAADQ